MAELVPRRKTDTAWKTIRAVSHLIGKSKVAANAASGQHNWDGEQWATELKQSPTSKLHSLFQMSCDGDWANHSGKFLLDFTRAGGLKTIVGLLPQAQPQPTVDALGFLRTFLTKELSIELVKMKGLVNEIAMKLSIVPTADRTDSKNQAINLALELLSVLCWLSEEGHSSVITALYNFQEAKRKSAFQLLTRFLADPNAGLQLNAMLLINTIINCCDKLDDRLALRRRLLEEGALDIIQKLEDALEANPTEENDTLLKQLHVFDEELVADKRLTTRKGVDLSNPTAVLGYVQETCRDVGAYNQLLTTLQMMMMTPLSARVGTRMWNKIQRTVGTITKHPQFTQNDENVQLSFDDLKAELDKMDKQDSREDEDEMRTLKKKNMLQRLEIHKTRMKSAYAMMQKKTALKRLSHFMELAQQESREQKDEILKLEKEIENLKKNRVANTDNPPSSSSGGPPPPPPPPAPFIPGLVPPPSMDMGMGMGGPPPPPPPPPLDGFPGMSAGPPPPPPLPGGMMPPPPPPLPGGMMPPPPPPLPGGMMPPPPPPMFPGMGGPPPPPPLPGMPGMPPPPPMLPGMGGPPPPPMLPGVGGPPPPPGMGPPMMMFAAPVVAPSKKACKPRVPMRKLHWYKMEERQITSTIWPEVDKVEDEVKFDVDQFETTFGEKKIEKKEVKKEEKKEEKKEAVTLVDAKRSNNVNIGLSRFKMSNETIKEKILTMDSEVLTLDNLIQLAKLIPQPDEVPTVVDFVDGGGEFASLANCEKFFYVVGKIPDLPRRLEFCTFKCEFPILMSQTEKEIALLEQAVGQVMENPRLPKVLALGLKLGNYMNGGTKSGEAWGFKLQTLGAFRNAKSADNKSTLMDFMVQTLQERGEADGVADSMSAVPLVVNIESQNFANNLQRVGGTIKKLEAAIAQAEKLAAAKKDKDKDAGGCEDKFVGVMKPFVVECNTRYNESATRFKDLEAQAAKMLAWYGEDPKMKWEDFFRLWLEFVEGFRGSEYNLQKLKEAKEKQAKRDAEAAAKAAKVGAKTLPAGGAGAAPAGLAEAVAAGAGHLRGVKTAPRLLGKNERAPALSELKAKVSTRVTDQVIEAFKTPLAEHRMRRAWVKWRYFTLKSLRFKQSTGSKPGQALIILTADPHRSVEEHRARNSKIYEGGDLAVAKLVGSRPSTPRGGVVSAAVPLVSSNAFSNSPQTGLRRLAPIKDKKIEGSSRSRGASPARPENGTNGTNGNAPSAAPASNGKANPPADALTDLTKAVLGESLNPAASRKARLEKLRKAGK